VVEGMEVLRSVAEAGIAAGTLERPAMDVTIERLVIE
jgi:hypothetical protein